MSNHNDGVASSFATYKNIWTTLAKAAAWATGIAGAFLTAPAQYTLGQSSTPAVMFLQFVTAGVFGLAFSVQARNRRKATHKRHLLYIGLSGVALIIFFYSYFFLQPLWSCPYAQRFLIVIGSALTPDATQYLASNPNLPPTCQNLLAEYAGNNLAIWDNSSLLARHVSLTMLFSFAWLSCVSTLILTIEYIKGPSSITSAKRPNRSTS